MKRLIITMILGIILPLTAGAQQENICMDSIAEIEILSRNTEGKDVYVRQPAELVPPGTVVIYTNSFTNLGDKPAEGITVNNAVPENMEYVAGSASKKGAEVSFSVDGGATYASPEKLTVTTKDGQTRPAQPKDYTHVRWTIQTLLLPGETRQVEFRALLK